MPIGWGTGREAERQGALGIDVGQRWGHFRYTRGNRVRGGYTTRADNEDTCWIWAWGRDGALDIHVSGQAGALGWSMGQRVRGTWI